MLLSFYGSGHPRDLHSFPTRRSSDLDDLEVLEGKLAARLRLVHRVHDAGDHARAGVQCLDAKLHGADSIVRSEEHTSELQSHSDLVCRLLLEKKKTTTKTSDSRLERT